MKRALLMVALATGCGFAYAGAEEPAPAAEPPPAAPPSEAKKPAATEKPKRPGYQSAPLPKVADLPCFKCHNFEAWGEGPGFPHAMRPHKKQGHCHVCHVGMGHGGTGIDKNVCVQCHEEPPGL